MNLNISSESKVSEILNKQNLICKGVQPDYAGGNQGWTLNIVVEIVALDIMALR